MGWEEGDDEGIQGEEGGFVLAGTDKASEGEEKDGDVGEVKGPARPVDTSDVRL